jgi:hypothetical protein
MMDIFIKLEFNRLIKELDFIDSDLIYKSSLLKLADENFIKDVNQVLESHPQLKTILEDKNQERMKFLNFVDVSIPISQETQDEEEDYITESKPTKLKSLYKEIAKSTHPDKSNQENLKEVYLDAQKAYESNDLLQILSICDRLKINYEISTDEFDLIRSEIDTKKQRIKFLESTYTWKWYHESSNYQKNQIIMNYLESQVSR